MSKITVTKINPSIKADLKRFVTLERKLMQNFPQFVSDIDDDINKLLSKKSIFSRDMDLCLFIASKDGQDLARCAAIINRRFQAEKQPGSGFIGFFAAAEGCDDAVGDMMHMAEDWLRENAVSTVIAPANGGAPQSMGFLATGYDESPMFPFPWHPPYYKNYIEELGYQATYPLWYYEVDFNSPKYREAKLRYAGQQAASIRTISKKNWAKDIDTLTDLLNATFVHEWEFTRVDRAFMQEFFGPMKPILEPEQILFAEIDNKPVAFCFGLPDLTPLFRSFKGSVGIFDLPKLLLRSKKYDRGGILGIGVLDEYRGKGISKAIALKLYSFYETKGLRSGLYYPVNEANMDSRGFAESIGGSGRVMYQVYTRSIAKL